MIHSPVDGCTRLPPLRLPPLRRRPLVAAMAGILGLAGALAVSASQAAEIDPEAVYAYCVSCHGNDGAGGEGGRYPRIAGLSRDYVDAQIHAFKAQERENKPMIPIFKHVKFDEDVIDLVSDYIASLPVPDLRLWPYDPDPDALAAFDSREAYVAAGEQAYRDQCAGCHGAEGQGQASAGAPALAAQYPTYLRKQMRDFAAGERAHAHSADCGAPAAATADAIVHHLVELGR